MNHQPHPSARRATLRLWEWAARLRRQFGQVQGEATMETLRRFRLFAAADQALYAAKNKGRNRVECEVAQSLAFPSSFASLRAQN